jgi:hypothetical protein
LNWEAAVALLTIAAVLYALARGLASADVVLLGAASFLMTMHVLSPSFPSPGQFAAAFGNEGLLTIGALFVVAAGLTETGAIAMVAERVMGRPRSIAAAQARIMLPVAGLSAFLNNTPVVAMFMPVISEWARKIDVSPSKLFIPLSYAAVLGGACTLIGTSTNLVVQGLMIQAQQTDPTMPTLGMWTLTPIGLVSATIGCYPIGKRQDPSLANRASTPWRCSSSRRVRSMARRSRQPGFATSQGSIWRRSSGGASASWRSGPTKC